MHPHAPTTIVFHPHNTPMIDMDFDAFDFCKDLKSTLCEIEADTFYHNTLNLKE
jgi:hypothetical protein